MGRVEMIENSRFVLTLLAALGCGLVAGAFFAFSSFVMKALGRLPPADDSLTGAGTSRTARLQRTMFRQLDEPPARVSYYAFKR